MVDVLGHAWPTTRACNAEEDLATSGRGREGHRGVCFGTWRCSSATSAMQETSESQNKSGKLEAGILRTWQDRESRMPAVQPAVVPGRRDTLLHEPNDKALFIYMLVAVLKRLGVPTAEGPALWM